MGFLKKKGEIGLTLIELLIVMAIIGVLASVMMVVINPARQMARARDTQRRSDLFSILSAVYQYQSEHSGALPDTDGNPLTSNFPTSSTCIGTGGGCFNLGNAGGSLKIVPDYMSQIPYDPKTGNSQNTGYTIFVGAGKRLNASASGEIDPSITVTR